MGDPNVGMYPKYRVERRDGKAIKGGLCFVLEIGDPNTWPALREYADTVRAKGYELLADDIERHLNWHQRESNHAR